MIKDKIIYSNDYTHLKSHCYSCNNPKHRTLECPYLSFGSRINKEMIIQKKNYSQPQLRKRFTRKKRLFKVHSLKDRKLLMKTAIIVRFNKDLMVNFENHASQNRLDNNYERSKSSTNNLDKLEQEYAIRKYSDEQKKESSENILVTKKYKSLEEINSSREIFCSDIEKLLKQKSGISLKKQEKVYNESKIFLNDGNSNELPSPQLRKPIISNPTQSIDNKKKENLTIVDKRGKKQLFIETKNLRSHSIRSDVEEIEHKDSATLHRVNTNTSRVKQTNSVVGTTPTLLKDWLHTKELFMYNFESIKEYETYFKERNASNIVKNLKTKKCGIKMRKSYRLI